MSLFSPDYTTSRARFRSAAIAIGAAVDAWPIAATGPGGGPLSIDVARVGPAGARRVVVVSSGVHGVEGYFGAAAQLALLERRLVGLALAPDTAVWLIHAVNPFGMAWVRRVNEDNVDLNRNFLPPGEAYVGAPDGYAALDPLLNPRRAPRPISAFIPRAAAVVARRGLPTLKNAVAGGQYQFPRGLFYGGAGPTESHRILAARWPAALAGAERVLHLDLHTGLGARATYKLFADHPWGSAGLARLTETFGPQVEPWEPKQGTSYTIRGGLGTWCKATFPQVDYDVLCAEFGTEGPLTVAAAMSRENRAWHYAPREGAAADRERRRFRRVFVPEDVAWRDTCVAHAGQLFERALSAVRA